MPEPPVSLFDVREGWRMVETHPSHQNARGKHAPSHVSMQGRKGEGLAVEGWWWWW